MEIREYNHHKLVSNTNRNNWFWKNISNSVKDKVVIDIGSGTGILGIMAIAKGAKHVIMIDHNPDCLNLTQHNLNKNNIPKEKYKLLENFDVDVLDDERPGVVISETLSGNFFGQPYYHFCQIIKESIHNPTIIPESLSANLVLTNSDKLGTEFLNSEKRQSTSTGVEEFDKNFTIATEMPRSMLLFNENLSRFIREEYIKNSDYIINDAITYNSYNPNTDLCWSIEADIPNGEYVIMLDTFLVQKEHKLSMGESSWVSHFYKFNKTSDTIKIKYDRDPRINDFIFF